MEIAEVDPNHLYQKPIYVDRFSEKFTCPMPINCNPYIGCAHNCSYCYAMFVQLQKRLWRPIRPANVKLIDKTFRGAMSGKLNSVLHKMIRRRVPIRFASMTDAFQPCERDLEITKQIFEIFAEFNYPVVMGVKGDVILDRPYIDLMKQFPITVQVSISTDNELLALVLEPKAPLPSRRLEIIKALSSENIITQLRLSPMMPLLTDNPMSLIMKAKENGAHDILTQWFYGFGQTAFTKHLEKALGYNYIGRLKQSGIPLITHGSMVRIAPEYINNYNISLKGVLANYGLEYYPTPDPIGLQDPGKCCCGVDKYPGYEGLLMSAFRTNRHRIRDHTTFDQYFYGYDDHPFLKEVYDYWCSGAFADGKEIMFSPESNTYSRLSVLANNIDKA